MTTPSGPLPPALGPLTWVAARFYGTGAKIAAARAEKRAPERLDVPVVSVGNVTAGGTGKSPFTAHIARALRTGGSHPAIALRGYRSEHTSGSDEAAEYKQHDPLTPVIVGRNRAEEVKRFQKDNPDLVDIVLLDDGFQHRRLYRDLDIVLVDCSRSGLDGDVLPHGWLREPAAALKRADLVVLTHASGNDALIEEQVERHRGRAPDAACCHAWSGIDVFEAGQDGAFVPVSDVLSSHRRVAVASGVGNPHALESHIRNEGFDVLEAMHFRDHAAYDDRSASRIAEMSRKAGALMVTGKDWVKLRKLAPIATLGLPVLVPRTHISFVRGGEAVRLELEKTCGHGLAL